MPLSFLEAMGHALPIVASSVGGVPEVVQDGCQGLLFPSGDLKTAVAQIESLAHDESLRLRLAGEALRAASNNWSADAMLDALSLSSAELSVLLCDDEVIRRLNREHRRLDRSTDVLSFSMREGEPLVSDEGAGQLLGDVVISLSTAARQAEAAGHGLLREVITLLAHGLLHLLGLDHQTDEEERRMQARTEMLRAAAEAPEI